MHTSSEPPDRGGADSGKQKVDRDRTFVGLATKNEVLQKFPSIVPDEEPVSKPSTHSAPSSKGQSAKQRSKSSKKGKKG
jgi:hypothetical protein